MNPDSITVALLEKTLKALKNYRKPPPGLFDLAILGVTNTTVQVERESLLRKKLEKIGFDALMRNRNNAHRGQSYSFRTPISTEDVLKDLKDDFSCGNSELEAWSAVYHLYLISPEWNLGVGELAAAALSGQFRRRVKDGLSRFVFALQDAELQTGQLPRELSLPAPEYSILFGVEPIIDQISSWLKMPDALGPLFISIEALGGWGKTAIARTVASRFMGSKFFTKIVWISARHEELNDTGRIRQIPDPARSTDDIVSHLADKFIPGRSVGLSREDKIDQIKPILEDKPYLVIIDNLETVNDIEELIPTIYPLAGKTRFLLTSRVSFSSFAYVQCIRVPELSRSDSFALIQSELQRRGRQIIPSNDEIDKIYSVIGGVPLALKLVTSQLMKHLSLTDVLDGLREAHSREEIYTYIYHRTWKELLDEPARLLLLSLQYIPQNGEDKTWIYENSLLPLADFNLALEQLLDCSLIEVTGSLGDTFYHLHRLTITFLQTEILLGWQE